MTSPRAKLLAEKLRGKKKRCSACRTSKSFGQFHRNKSTLDGREYYCKICLRRIQADWRRTSPVYAAYRPIIAKSLRRRRKLSRYKEMGRENARKARLRYPEKHKCRVIFTKAVRGGKIVRPKKCEECGKGRRKIHGHHADYTKPLLVKWLCVSCHHLEHNPQLKRAIKGGGG